MNVIMVFLMIIAVCIVWMMIANTRTYNMRTKIIDNWTKAPNWRDAATAFRSVNYNTHHWHVLTLRDPRKLYPPVIWQTMGWKGIGELDTPEAHTAYIRERINPVVEDDTK